MCNYKKAVPVVFPAVTGVYFITDLAWELLVMPSYDS